MLACRASSPSQLEIGGLPMRILQFRVSGIGEPEPLREDRRARHSSTSRSYNLRTQGLAQSTILIGTLVVATLVVRSTSLRNGYVLEVMQQTGTDLSQARLAVDLAERTNAFGEVVLAEALDKATVIKAAAGSDPPEALGVTGVTFATVGEIATAQITPARSGITLQATVSGTDNYYASHSLQTDSSGRASFSIPAGEPGVVDTLSVSAVLTGVTAGQKFTWCAGRVPCSSP